MHPVSLERTIGSTLFPTPQAPHLVAPSSWKSGGPLTTLVDGPVHYTADVSQASAPLRVRGGTMTSPGFLGRHDLFQDQRMAIVCSDILLDVSGSVPETVAHQVVHAEPFLLPSMVL